MENINTYQSKPMLAIFWYIDGEFIGLSDSLDGAVIASHNRGSMKCIDTEHETIWENYRNEMGVTEGIGYNYYPRGKIIYLETLHTFKVFFDSRAYLMDGIKEKIIRFYNLPENTIFEYSYNSFVPIVDCPLPDGLSEATREELERGWKKIQDKYRDDSTVNLETYKCIFLRTWNYFMRHIHPGSKVVIDCGDIGIIRYMAAFAAGGYYPKNIKNIEFSACTALIESFIDSLKNPCFQYYGGNFFDGTFQINLDHMVSSAFRFNDYDHGFEQLCDFFDYGDEDDEDEEYDEQGDS